VGGRKESVKGRQQRAERVVRKRQPALWNIASVEKLDLGRVSIPRGEPQSRKARQVLRTTEFFKNITAEAKSLSAWRKAHSALRTEFRVLSTKPKLLSAKGIAQSIIR